MSVSGRLRQRWTDDELVIMLDLSLNHGFNDSHNHDAIAKCLGRYNANTNSHKDGPVNQKLSEIMSIVDSGRAKRHTGTKLTELAEKYEKNLRGLRKDAVKAWKNVLESHSGTVPSQVQRLLR